MKKVGYKKVRLISLAASILISGCGMIGNAADNFVGVIQQTKRESEDWDYGFKIAYKEVKSSYDGNKTFSNPENDYSKGELFEGKYAVLMMDDPETASALYRTINRNADARIADFEKTTLEVTKQARAAYEDAIDNDRPFSGPYYYYENVNVIRADDTLVSTTTTIDEFYGGPHDNIVQYGCTYDTRTGEELRIGDVLKCSEDELRRILTEELHATEEDENQFMNLDNTLSHYKFEPVSSYPSDDENAELPYNWYFAGDGLHFIFNVYELTSYNYGASDVVIGYDEYEGVIDEKYIPAADSYYVTSHTVYAGSDKPDENGITLDFIADVKNSGTMVEYYYVHQKDGKAFTYVVLPEEDESYKLFVYEVTDGNPRPVSIRTCERSAEELKDGYTAYPAYAFWGRDLMGR
ncbi:MAG: DUF3298 and DUF4163 domain-containing protein [Butyrivibrio sp.]|nr:DUF3298 and DUF4163 domain-containing protein [Butyrivibrio sp.]